MKIVVFEAEERERAVFDPLLPANEIVLVPEPLRPGNAKEYGDAEVVSTFIYSDLGAAVIEQLPRLKLIATSVLGGKKLSEALKDVQPGSVLDFNYFVTKIEPILATPGADGKACVFCHASHVIFKLQPPNTEGVFSDQDSEENYKYAMRVVDINDPGHSLILVKPTRPTDSAGNVGDYLATHNGGQRWPGNESSWQFRTILQWIRGSQLHPTVAQK